MYICNNIKIDSGEAGEIPKRMEEEQLLICILCIPDKIV